MSSLLQRLGGIPPAEPRAAVLADLRRLLAAHPGMAAAQPWLGVPLDPGAGPAGLERLRSAIQVAIERGEPRLSQVRVTAEAGADGIARVSIAATADGMRIALDAEADGAVLRPLRAAGGGT